MKWLSKGALKIICLSAVCTAILIFTLGETRGINTAGKGVDVGGVSFGAVIGFIPRFFGAASHGQDLATPTTTTTKS